MDGINFNPLWTWLSGPDAVWRWVWLALALVTVVLLVLMRTRWGQSRAMEKCVLLSLLTHVLLASAAATVQLAGGAVLRDVGTITYVDAADENAEDDAAAASSSSPRRWDLPAEEPLPDVQPREAPRPAQPRTTPVLAASLSETLDPATAANLRAALPKPKLEMPSLEERPPVAQRTDAAAIETPDAPRAVEPQPGISPVPGPERVATSPTPQAVKPDSSPGAAPATPSAPNLSRVLTDNGPPRLPLDKEGSTSSGRPSVVRPADVQASTTGQPGASASVANSSADGVTAANAVARGTPGAAMVPSVYSLRSSPDRAKAAQRFGATPQTEAAVKAALQWLARNQSADGRWDVMRLEGGREPKVLGEDREGAGIGADTGVTGLAVLAFLGAGHTHLAGEHRDTVRRGLEYLLNSQADDGNLAGNARRFARMYCHAMATCALSEAYVLTRDDRLAPGLKSAIRYCIDAQNPSTGGWRYQPHALQVHEVGDMSQHGWQIMALKSAELAGIEIPQQVRTRAARFVELCSSGKHRGLAGYKPQHGPSRSMTAEALVCRRFLGMTVTDEQLAEAQEYVLGELPGRDTPNCYYWYYATLALHQDQGDAWRRWNDALQQSLLPRQRTAGNEAGSWDPTTVWGGYGGRTYSTAIAALSLEVYYRFLPLYGRK